MSRRAKADGRSTATTTSGFLVSMLEDPVGWVLEEVSDGWGMGVMMVDGSDDGGWE